ncbi:hypothetical protein B0I37DRAFT_385636 [Chaetomium sp. MPI-CAGE-AT-0009]|nr:hypothetical protein B0I37DRAFT_385636 [Chaetomium sp. MPI-CAGE-AT-0009]
MNSNTRLKKPTDWQGWFDYIYLHARHLDVWDIINPNVTIPSERAMLEQADVIHPSDILNELVEQRAQRFQDELRTWEQTSPDARGERPSEPVPPTREEIQIAYLAAVQEQRREYESRFDPLVREKVMRMYTLIAGSVDNSIYGLALRSLTREEQYGVRAILQALRKVMAPMSRPPEGS